MSGIGSSVMLAAGVFASNWSHLGDHFSGKGSRVDTGELATLGVVGLIATVVIGGLWWVSRHGETWLRRPNPGRLFRDLCETHRLTTTQQTLLRELAAAAELSQPAELFLRPEFFNQGSAAGKLKGRGAAVAELRETLFGDIYAEAVTEAPVKEEAVAEAGDQPPVLEATV